MDELKTFTKVKTISSREVAEMMEVTHFNLIQKIEKINEVLLNSNFNSVDYWYESSYKDSTGRTLKEYQVTKKGCEMLAHKSTGDKGIIFTARYIDRFNEMEKYMDSYLIEDRIERAKRWIEEQQERELLIAANEEMKPKAEFYDAVVDSKDAIEIGQVAKVIGTIGRNKLFQFLRNNDILMKNNEPYQKYIDCGWFRVIEQKYTKPDGTIMIRTKTLVYQKGVNAIRKMIGGNYGRC